MIIDNTEFSAAVRELGLEKFNCNVTAVKADRFETVRKKDAATVYYTKKVELIKAVADLAAGGGSRAYAENFKSLGFMADCSRSAVLSVDGVKKLIRKIASLGFDTLMLYTEDTYEVENEPFFGYLRGRYSLAELRELTEYGELFGVELVPCIQTLAHLNQIFRWREYTDINDTGDILLAGEERTYRLLENMFSSLRSAFKSNRINIGMDEAHMLGLGKYLDRHGYTDRVDIMVKHLEKVSELAEKYGFSPMMWSDMFFRLAFAGDYYADVESVPDEITKKMPRNVTLLYWDYYHTTRDTYDAMLKKHKLFSAPVGFAGGAWKWTGFAPNNVFSLKSSKAALDSCLDNGIESVIATAWGDDGGECSVFSVMPALAYYSARTYDADFSDENFEKRFAALTGVTMEDFLKLDRLNNIDSVVDENQTSTFAKAYLYADPFLGFTDSTVGDGIGRAYGEIAGEIAKVRAGEYSREFRTLSDLARVLELKAELGVTLRRRYAERDREGMRKAADSISELIKRVKKFYKSFKAQWYAENKPQGFEVHDVRIGGLLLRLAHCREEVAAYADGRTQKIAELDEPILDYLGNGFKRPEFMYLNSWTRTVTPGPISTF